MSGHLVIARLLQSGPLGEANLVPGRVTRPQSLKFEARSLRKIHMIDRLPRILIYYPRLSSETALRNASSTGHWRDVFLLILSHFRPTP